MKSSDLFFGMTLMPKPSHNVSKNCYFLWPHFTWMLICRGVTREKD